MNHKVTPTLIEIAPIQYQHYKGGLYKVLHTAFDSETLEPMVVYESLQTHDIWVRSAQMFTQSVCVHGKWIPRFKPMGCVEHSETPLIATTEKPST